MAITLPTFGAPPEAPRQTVSPIDWPVFSGSPDPLPSRQTVPSVGALPEGKPGSTVIEELLAELRAKADSVTTDENNPVTTGAATIGAGLGRLANDELMNRLSRGELTQGYDQLMLQAQTGRNQTENDALKKLAITNYLRSGGYTGGPTTISLGGQQRTLPSFGSAPRGASAAQVAGATTLEDMLTQRLMSGGSYLPQAPDYTKPGKVENVGRYGGAIAGGVGAIYDLMRKRSSNGV